MRRRTSLPTSYKESPAGGQNPGRLREAKPPRIANRYLPAEVCLGRDGLSRRGLGGHFLAPELANGSLGVLGPDLRRAAVALALATIGAVRALALATVP